MISERRRRLAPKFARTGPEGANENSPGWGQAKRARSGVCYPNKCRGDHPGLPLPNNDHFAQNYRSIRHTLAMRDLLCAIYKKCSPHTEISRNMPSLEHQRSHQNTPCSLTKQNQKHRGRPTLIAAPIARVPILESFFLISMWDRTDPSPTPLVALNYRSTPHT